MAEVRLHSRAQEAEADAAAAAEHQRLAAEKLAVVQSRLVGFANRPAHMDIRHRVLISLEWPIFTNFLVEVSLQQHWELLHSDV